MKRIFLALVLTISAAAAQAQACPNQANSITIPLVGSALLAIYDQNCNVLPGAGFSVMEVTPVNANWASNSSPQVVPAGGGSGASLQFTAGNALPGTQGTFKATYAGNNNLTITMGFLVGSAVTSLSAGTSTP